MYKKLVGPHPLSCNQSGQFSPAKFLVEMGKSNQGGWLLQICEKSRFGVWRLEYDFNVLNKSIFLMFCTVSGENVHICDKSGF